MARFALNLTTCSHFGEYFAANGKSVADISSWCTKNGYSATGRTFRRILHAYNAQVARG